MPDQNNAFPREDNKYIEYGLTTKEYYAAAAMQGLLANPEFVATHSSRGSKALSPDEIAKVVAEHAERYASAMIKTIKPE